MFSRKIKFVIFDCSFAKVEAGSQPPTVKVGAAHFRRKVAHERSEWGALRQKIVFPTLFSKKRAGFGAAPHKSLVKLARPQVLQALRRLCFAAAESFNNFVKLILFKLHTCRINNKPCAYRCNLSYDFKSVFLECGACFDNIYYTIGKP